MKGTVTPKFLSSQNKREKGDRKCESQSIRERISRQENSPRKRIEPSEVNRTY